MKYFCILNKGVDDIFFKPSPGSCNLIPIEASTSTTPAPLTTTSTPSAQPLGEFDCNFEKSCPWYEQQPPSSYISWTVLNASIASSQYNGPSIDHTLGTSEGSFLTPIVKNFSLYSSSYYYSPSLNSSKCLEFWYIMRGSEVYNLVFFSCIKYLLLRNLPFKVCKFSCF